MKENQQDSKAYFRKRRMKSSLNEKTKDEGKLYYGLSNIKLR